jgi:hypothetical protein
MKSHLLIAGPLLASMLAACGTTSNIKPTRTAEALVTVPSAKGKPALDLSGYDKVVVLDYVDATDKSKIKPGDLSTYSDHVTTAAHEFADLIAHKLRATGAFTEVVRGPSPGKALVVSGHITRLTEGNATLRLLIGMGAGSSYFDASTDLADAESGTELGQVATDRNSWVLGGGLAAGQTVQSFMDGAADKIAADLREGKAGIAVAKTH